MIITENVTINDVQYKYTKSSLGYYIQRNDGKQFIDAYDKIDSTLPPNFSSTVVFRNAVNSTFASGFIVVE